MTDLTLDYAKPANDDAVEGSRWGWAAYLGASWTWCIGMFLPVLLVRDYGPWAWVIFAVPNVVGAGAMGWVMRTRDTSRQYVADHASACRLFSFVTIAFQLFFAIWMLPRLVGPAGYGVAIVIAQSAFTPLTRLKWLRAGGAVALGVSVLAAAVLAGWGFLRWPGTGRSPFAFPVEIGTIGPAEALGLMLVCGVGFFACPYLDLTFHRARRATGDGAARTAFGVGFGVLFAAMIVFTFFYADLLIPWASRASVYWSFPSNTKAIANGRLAAWLLATHLAVQMTYTVHAHAAELVRQADVRRDPGTMRAGLSLWLGVAFAAGLMAVTITTYGSTQNRMPTGELLYRLFMSAYGLLFPAYVLLTVRRIRVSTIGWLGVVAAAAFFYWLAFVQRQMAWASAGVLVMAVGVVVVRQLTPKAAALPLARTE